MRHKNPDSGQVHLILGLLGVSGNDASLLGLNAVRPWASYLACLRLISSQIMLAPKVRAVLRLKKIIYIEHLAL